MDISNFLFSLPAQVKVKLPAIPVFEVAPDSEGTSVSILTRTELAELLLAHNSAEGWFIPVRPASMEDEMAAERMADIVASCLVNNLTFFDQYHIPDIKTGKSILPSILVIDPSNESLAELTSKAHVDFIVHIKIDRNITSADTQAMDIILMPIHNN